LSIFEIIFGIFMETRKIRNIKVLIDLVYIFISVYKI
jgi:hypothetical protein